MVKGLNRNIQALFFLFLKLVYIRVNGGDIMDEFIDFLADHGLTITSFSRLISVNSSTLKRFIADSGSVGDEPREKITVGKRVLEKTGLVRPRLSHEDMREMVHRGSYKEQHTIDVVRFERDFKRAFKAEIGGDACGN